MSFWKFDEKPAAVVWHKNYNGKKSEHFGMGD